MQTTGDLSIKILNYLEIPALPDKIEGVQKLLIEAKLEWISHPIQWNEMEEFTLLSLLSYLCKGDDQLIGRIQSKNRITELVKLRREYCWLAKKLWKDEKSWREIGSWIHRDHASVIHHYNKMNIKMEKNRELQINMMTLLRELREVIVEKAPAYSRVSSSPPIN